MLQTQESKLTFVLSIFNLNTPLSPSITTKLGYNDFCIYLKITIYIFLILQHYK